MKDLRAALDIRQDFPHAHLNLGTLYLEMGDLSEAKRALETALVQKPDFNDALFNLSLVHLLKGDYENGWPLYEARWKRSQGLEQMKYKRLPLLSSLRNLSTKRVLVWCEQGLGDSIQFARYLDHLAKLSGRVAFHCQSILYKLLERANLGVDLFDKEVEQKNYDFQIPLMSLPGLFYSSGYHQTPPPLRLDIPLSNLEHWASQMKCEKSTIKVGLSWQGSKATIVDIGRSIPLHLFKELLGVPSVRFYSLQKGYGSEQVESIAFPIEVLSNMDDGRESAFLDTAAVIKNLDLVVTSDTAVAHLAGSLRVPTWVLLKKSPDWRWGFTSNQSHWYESVTLFRQAKVGDWVEVLRRVKSALSSLTPGGGLLL
jgi:tetratricopeptide (TPR) repeat protein